MKTWLVTTRSRFAVEAKSMEDAVREVQAEREGIDHSGSIAEDMLLTSEIDSVTEEPYPEMDDDSDDSSEQHERPTPGSDF